MPVGSAKPAQAKKPRTGAASPAAKVYDAEYRRKRAVLYSVSLFVSLQSGSYGLFLVRIGESPFSGWTLFLVSLFSLCNLLAFQRHRNVEKALFLFTLTGIIANIITLTTPSFDRTSIYWMPTFPVVAFFLVGLRRGLVINGLYFAGYVGLMAAQALGVVDTPYSITQYMQMLVAMTFVFLCGFAAEQAQERFRKQLVAQRERLNVIMGRMPAGVMVFDAPDGKPSASNEAAEALLGAPLDATVPLSRFARTYALTAEDGTPFPSEKLPMSVVLRDGKDEASADVFMARQGGDPRVLHMASAPIRNADGRVIAAVCVVEDMTKRFEVDQMKSKFVSLASHQLKTPLTSIAWAVESVLEDGKKLPEDLRKTLEMAQEATVQMNTLVRDLLNVSRIETGRKFAAVLAPTDMIPMLKDIVASLQGMASQRRVNVSMRGLPKTLMLPVDPEEMHEALMNVVSNAVKYSKDGGKVEFDVTAKGDMTTISVRDAGIGIPREYQDRIFSKFFRAPNVIQGIEGTGLGLYIVKTIVEKHGGTVSFESKEGEGTTFFITLPKETKAA